MAKWTKESVIDAVTKAALGMIERKGYINMDPFVWNSMKEVPTLPTIKKYTGMNLRELLSFLHEKGAIPIPPPPPIRNKPTIKR